MNEDMVNEEVSMSEEEERRRREKLDLIYPGRKKDHDNTDSDSSQRRAQPTVYPKCYHEIKNKVVNRLFMGEYLERRHMKHINEYRDVVAVNPSEIPFLHDLKTVIKCAERDKNCCWLPISGPSESIKTYRLYVSLPEGTAFDKYWFQVRSVKYTGQQLNLRLKIVRNVAMTDHQSVPTVKDADSTTPSMPQISSSDVKNFLIYVFTEVVTLTNIVNAFRVLILALAALAAGLVEFTKHLGMWSIAFTRELGILVERCTPLALGVTNVFSRIVGGFYILITHIFRDLRHGNQPPVGRPDYMPVEGIEECEQRRRLRRHYIR